MATMLEYLAVDASAGLTKQDRQTLLNAYTRDDDSDGSIIVALMIVSIIVNVARLVMDHCVDKDQFTARALKPRYVDKRNARRRARQIYRQMKIGPDDMGGITSEQIADEMLTSSVNLSEETLATVWDEGEQA
jgi:hypothetical protein